MKRSGSLVFDLSTTGEKVLRRCSSDYSCSSGCLAGFLILPFNIRHQILSLVEIIDLISLWEVCRDFQLMIQRYCTNCRCPQLSHFYDPHDHEEHSSRKPRLLVTLYKHTGSLFRRIYHYKPISRKLQFLECTLSRHMPDQGQSYTISPSLQEQECSSICRLGPLKCSALFLYGVFLKEFVFGWPERNIQRVFHTLVHICFNENFWFRLSSLICQRPGVDPQSELRLRLFLRKTFLDPIALPHMYDEFNPSSLPISSTNHCLASNTSPIAIHYNTFLNLHQFEIYSKTPWTRETFSHHVLSSYSSANDRLSAVLPSTSAVSSGDFTVTHVSSVVETSPHPTVTMQTSSSSSNKQKRDYFWPASNTLMRILHSYPYSHQARILFILYGPLHRGNLMWRTMCENTAADSEQLTACFGELGSVLSNMYNSGLWTSEDIINILDHITITPDDWLAENVACLLHTSDIISTYPKLKTTDSTTLCYK
ncbi:F-box only protein isoform 2 [Schistosoma japonicum]|uniref:F-box only protein isoform 2 n=1 Tax=Schistosoma japonicum TaxID=6182 RepID=A0A4Z2DBN5_SCHJA|nr:F-box only protein isoform 2 [Schistosoma japonicum]